MAQFQLGNPGKPKGTKNKAYFRISYWLDKIHDEWPQLNANQRANISLELAKILINKSKALPTNPEDSKFNIDSVKELLAEVEQAKVKPNDPPKV